MEGKKNVLQIYSFYVNDLGILSQIDSLSSDNILINLILSRPPINLLLLFHLLVMLTCYYHRYFVAIRERERREKITNSAL